MAEVARFFDTVSYGESDQAEVQARMWRDGVCVGVAGELAVTSGGTGLVSVATGEGFVQGFWYKNTAAKTLAITANASATPRVDLVVLHLDRVANTLLAIVHEGVLGGGAPALTQIVGGTWEILLATVSTSSSVSTITDARLWQSNMFNPMTTSQDIIIANAAGIPIRKAKGANGTYLGVDGAGNLNYSVPTGFANPMTTASDIIVGGTSGVATRAAKGANSSIFGVNASGVLGYYTDPHALIPVGTLHGNRLIAGSVTNNEIADRTINSADIAVGAVTTTELQDRGIAAVDVAVGALTWTELYGSGGTYGAATARASSVTGPSSNPAVAGNAFYQFPDPAQQITMPVTGDVFIFVTDSYFETGSTTIVQLYAAIIGVTGWTMCSQNASPAAGGRYSMGGDITIMNVPAGTWAINMAADGNNAASTITHLAAGRTMTVFARYR
jgi:hypothetical protein